MKIAIVDDQPLVLRGLTAILEAQPDFLVIWTAENGEQAVNLCGQQPPDVVLMDIRMPVKNGVEATKEIKMRFPSVKVIVLTTFMEDNYIFQTLKYGANGYLLKDALPEEIVSAIQKAVAGGTAIEAQVATKIVERIKDSSAARRDERFSQLTAREMDIARAVASGFSNREIAEQLYLSEGTIKNYLTAILEKLALRDRTQLAIWVLKNDF